jgi:hypothetical protein
MRLASRDIIDVCKTPYYFTPVVRLLLGCENCGEVKQGGWVAGGLHTSTHLSLGIVSLFTNIFNGSKLSLRVDRVY